MAPDGTSISPNIPLQLNSQSKLIYIESDKSVLPVLDPPLKQTINLQEVTKISQRQFDRDKSNVDISEVYEMDNK